ncbi:tRNA (adenine(22)-N(1))-methyltransferase [Virgibacillus xinjiangensis]|uniref:tRNA (Adenine(22)-N(1))-methyltransferase n=1 Tax=Virgibacillus xinjiangensis TaxID=393090 RepID=A0ABV7CRN4_9BACI
MTNTIRLSDRLKVTASYLPEEALFADIGSDHAYLPCYVCQNDGHAKAIAGEVRKGPYESALSTVRQYGLSHAVEVRLGDGLQVLEPAEVNQVVIAGMGGSLIQSILQEGKDKLSSVERIIAQPNIDARNVRRWFSENGYTIIDEQILKENGHIYEVIVADKSADSLYGENDAEKQLLFGPVLLENKTPAFYQKWEQELSNIERIIRQMKQAREQDLDKIKRFEMEADWIKEVLGQ